MRYRDLTPAQHKEYIQALTESHAIRTNISVYDKDEDLIGTLGSEVTGGQIDCDATNDITRTLSLEITDQRVKFAFDPMGTVYADNYIGVTYGVYVSSISHWVDVPVFFGPVSRYERDGNDVSIEAVGKESLMLPPVKQPKLTDPTDRRIVSYVRSVAADFGEARFSTGDVKNKRVPKRFALDPAKAKDDGAWRYLQQLCDAVNYELFYDGRGALCIRPAKQNKPKYVFKTILSEPSLGFDLQELRNVVNVMANDEVNGKTSTVLLWTSRLAASHPLSPEKLGRNGIPRVLSEDLKFDTTKMTQAEARKKGDDYLDKHSRAILDVQFDSLVIPHLEVGDLCRVQSDTLDTAFSLQKFTIPLSATDAMTVGYTKQYAVGKFKTVRKHRKSNH